MGTVIGPTAAVLADGHRIHLQHGPIDLIIGVDGDPAAVALAKRAAWTTTLITVGCVLLLAVGWMFYRGTRTPIQLVAAVDKGGEA